MPTRHVLRVLTFCVCVVLAPLGSIAGAAQVSETSSQSAVQSSTASGSATASGPKSAAAAPVAPLVAPVRVGYTPVRTSLPARGTAFTSAVVRTALRFLGRPYKWAGIGDRGFDCSGLVSRVFAAMDLAIPHSSVDQYRRGMSIPLSSLNPGDLVFFHTYNSGPSHVGIYVGADRFIHASYSRGVIISSMNEPYYRYRYLGARRL